MFRSYTLDLLCNDNITILDKKPHDLHFFPIGRNETIFLFSFFIKTYQRYEIFYRL
jgi:hypothetical protein